MSIELSQDKVKLVKGQRGTYGWEITLADIDVENLKKIDRELREAFRGEDDEEI